MSLWCHDILVTHAQTGIYTKDICEIAPQGHNELNTHLVINDRSNRHDIKALVYGLPDLRSNRVTKLL